MLTKNDFDALIRKAYCEYYSKSPFGYPIADPESNYPNYFSAQEFQGFVDKMKKSYPNAYQKYANGKGSELGPSKNAPPKMASVASSSRFCYKALRDGAHALGGSDTEFEFECSIDGIRGTAPQMDSYSAEGNLFIEVKCHEIFDKHTIALSRQYYGWLCEKENGFGLILPKPECNNQIRIPLSTFGADEDCKFDIKQLLCHLMGVASKSKEHPATLVYLFFKPQLNDSTEQLQIDEIFCKLAAEIKAIFTSSPIVRFCNANHITLRAVAQNAPVMQPLKADHIIILF